MLQSLYLAIGYATGQGVVFLWQLYAKIMGHQYEAGYTVLLVSLLSFPLQFSDLGNQALIVRRYALQSKDIDLVVTCRAILGFVCTALMCISVAIWGDRQISVFALLLLPLVGFTSGISLVGISEARQKYLRVAIAQALPWQVMGLSCPLLLMGADWDKVIVILVLASSFGMASTFYRIEAGGSFKFKPTVQATYSVLAVAVPPILGQIWGRAIVLVIATWWGIAQLGDFGIFRYLQVFLMLGVGFLLRPSMTAFIHSQSRAVTKLTAWEFYRHHSRLPLGVALLGPFLGMALLFVQSSNAWALILFAVPLAIISGTCVQLNQMMLERRWALTIEITALVCNMITFGFMVRVSAPAAIVLGEAAQFLVNIVAHWVIVQKVK